MVVFLYFDNTRNQIGGPIIQKKRDFLINNFQKYGRVIIYLPELMRYLDGSSNLQLQLEYYDPQFIVNNAYQLVKNLNEKVIVVGTYFSGLYAYLFCNKYPDKCEKLIFIEETIYISKFNKFLIKDNNNLLYLTKEELSKINNIDYLRSLPKPKSITDLFTNENKNTLLNIFYYKYQKSTQNFSGKINIPTLNLDEKVEIPFQYIEKNFDFDKDSIQSVQNMYNQFINYNKNINSKIFKYQAFIHTNFDGSWPLKEKDKFRNSIDNALRKFIK